MQRAAKNIVYTISNSNAMNGLSKGSKVVSIIPLWQKALIGFDIIMGILLILIIIIPTMKFIKQKKALSLGNKIV